MRRILRGVRTPAQCRIFGNRLHAGNPMGSAWCHPRMRLRGALHLWALRGRGRGGDSLRKTLGDVRSGRVKVLFRAVNPASDSSFAAVARLMDLAYPLVR